MRDPNRIYEFIKVLTEAWANNPDLRFGQIIENIKRYSNKSDLFYLEDEDMLQIIRDYFDLDE